MHYRHSSKMLIIVVLIIMFLIGIGYASISSKLNIIGNAELSTTKWSVQYENVVVTDGSVLAKEPVISGNTSVSYEITLKRPGDFYEFTVDVVNKGSLNAVLAKIESSEIPQEHRKYLSYSLTYADDDRTPLRVEDELPAKESRTILIRVEFKKDITAADLSRDEVSIEMNLKTLYVQAGSDITDVDFGENENNKNEEFVSENLILGYSWTTVSGSDVLVKTGDINRVTVDEPLLVEKGESAIFQRNSDYVFGYFFVTIDEEGNYHWTNDVGWQTGIANNDIVLTAYEDEFYLVVNWRRVDNTEITEADLENIKSLVTFRAAEEVDPNEKNEGFVSNNLILNYTWATSSGNNILRKNKASNRITVEEPLLMKKGDTITFKQNSGYVFGYFFATLGEDGNYHWSTDAGWQTGISSHDIVLTAPDDNVYLITNWKKANNGNLYQIDLDSIKLLIEFTKAG